MSSHSVNNSQCDLNMYGPDPGDGTIKCTCDEDAPIEPAVGPARGAPPAAPRSFPHLVTEATTPGVVVLNGRKALLHAELEAATRELHAARQLLTPAEARWRKALDAYSEALLQP